MYYSNMTTLPIGGSWSVLIVFNGNNGAGVAQLVINISSEPSEQGRTFIRGKIAGTSNWTSWKEIQFKS